MNQTILSPVEKAFYEEAGAGPISTRIPYITVDNFPKLGMLSALRFLEWTLENPEGTVSLPTGKTPEHFIKWTGFLLENWNKSAGEKVRKRYGIETPKKPVLKGLQFVQIDEFYPIDSSQHNSFYYYINKYYLDGFGLDKDRSLMINCNEIPLPGDMSFNEVFPGNKVDLSLRYRECIGSEERLQQKAIFMIDDWCSGYEQAVREKGGLGFFLGGIGPDGHIAFNTRGSDHHSSTRLTETNFETQAVAASDLGGIEISRNRLVITIGLDTITYNPDTVAIIFAAGEAKADVVRNAMEEEPSVMYPATCLHKRKNSRFYLTLGAAALLKDSLDRFYRSGSWTQEKSERAVINLCKKLNKYGNRITLEDLKDDPFCSLIPDLNETTVETVQESINKKIQKGLKKEVSQSFLHTGPHHDDIMLGMLPHVARTIRTTSNTSFFSVLTSGFTAITNSFINAALSDTRDFLDNGLIQMVEYPDFFNQGYKYKWDKDVYHYLNKVASGDPRERRRGLCHRIIRAIVDIYDVKNKDHLRDKINEIIVILTNSYDGEKNPAKIQKLKGVLREFEEELVWAHFGVRVKHVRHLRLGFYTGDIFTEQPEKKRDVVPILETLKELNPTIISLAFDPEGSGPDTHYKVLQAIAEAVREWSQETDLSGLRIWGYRNVWYRFLPSEADVIVPVSLNALATLEGAFTDCYLSQVEASFPSYMLDGTFSELTQKIWVEQLKDIQYLMGKDYFYQNDHPTIRSSHGILYFREMNVEEFLKQARKLEQSTEGSFTV
jgi:glucosamine-6-phosphate deaminase